jgi:hypothetical protein
MVAPSELSEQQRDLAQRRFEVLRPHIEDGVALADAAAADSIPAPPEHSVARLCPRIALSVGTVTSTLLLVPRSSSAR